MTKAKIAIIMCLLATRSAREHSDLILLDKSAHLSETVIMVHDESKTLTMNNGNTIGHVLF